MSILLDRILDTVAATQSSVILAQFAFSVVTLSTLAFQTTIVIVYPFVFSILFW